MVFLNNLGISVTCLSLCGPAKMSLSQHGRGHCLTQAPMAE